MGGGMGPQQYAGIIGGSLGGIGDIIQATKHHKLKAPKATAREERLRRFTMQDLANARQTVYGNEALYNQAMPFMLGAIPGYSAEVETDPRATAQFDQLQAAADQRAALQHQQVQARATLRGTKAGKGRRKAPKAALKAIRQQLKGSPNIDELYTALNRMQATPARLKFSKNAPTETDLNAQNIQNELSNRTLAALHGELPNPTLEHNLGREQESMENAMRQQLGPDWENSSAGIAARQQFNQYANDQRDMSNRRDIAQLYPEQLAGQQAQYGFAGAQQSLLGNPSLEGLRFAQGLGASGAAATGAQSPYAADRATEFGVTGANWAYGDKWGHGLQQSGDRWISAAGAMGGGGGSPSSMPAPQAGGNNSQVASGAYAVD